MNVQPTVDYLSLALTLNRGHEASVVLPNARKKKVYGLIFFLCFLESL